MAHYQVILAYDGTHYAGFQRQANAATIQGKFEAALRKIGWQGSSILASGRTDKGVHALGQVVVFEMDWVHGAAALQSALNASLPSDISARSIRQVMPDFHPRNDALWRHYRYRLVCQPVRNPLCERFAWRIWPAPPLDRLEQTARLLIGRHDFAGFGSPPIDGGSTIRQVKSAGWTAADDQVSFDVIADAFLYHMVRKMVFIQLAVIQGKLTEELLVASLQAGTSLPVTGIAPAKGLALIEVRYSDKPVNHVT